MAGQTFTTIQEYRASLNADAFRRGVEEVDRGSVKAVGAIDRLIGKFDRLQAAENKRASGLAEVGRLFERGLTGGREDEAIRKIEGAFDQATASTGRFATGLGVARSALGALGVAFSAQAIIGFGRDAFNVAANLNELAEQAGVGVEALQAYRAIMAEGGIATSQADAIITRFTRSIGEARDGSQRQVEAFRALGVSARELSGGAEAAFPKAIAGLLAIPDAADRARIEVDLFARSGQRLESVLGSMTGSTEEMIAHAKGLGLVMGKDLTTAADEASDRMSQAWQRATVAFAPLVGAIGNGISKLLELAAAADAAKRSSWESAMAPMFSSARNIGQEAAARLHADAGAAGIPFRAGGPSSIPPDDFAPPDFADQFAQYQRSAEAMARDALETMEAGIKTQQKFETDLIAGQRAFLNRFQPKGISKPGGVGAFGSVVPILGGKPLQDHSEEINALADFHKEAAERWGDYHKRTAEGQRDWTDNFVSSLDFAFDNLTRQIARGKTDLRDLGDVAGTIVQGMLADFLKLTVADPLKDAAGSLLKSFIGGMVGGVGGGIPSGNIAITPSPITGGYSAGFAGGFAEGGTIGPGKWGLVGEGGQPEIVHAGTAGATVTPMKSSNVTLNIDARGASPGEAERFRAIAREEIIPAMQAAVAGGAAVGYGAVSRRMRYSGRGGL